MKKLIEKPHLVFFLPIPFILLIGVLGGGGATLDINIHDTYFVIALSHFTILISILLGLISIGYWSFEKAKRPLSRWLTLIHVFFTFVGLTILIATPFLFDDDNESSLLLFEKLIVIVRIQIYTGIMILFGQLAYLINIIIGVIRKNKSNIER